ncbi:MAG: YeeE/YedE family protein [Burkholderiales bacterium]|nr:MAG: YeeE/YedE family protein [Burkholderiales bacterium]
MDTSLPPAALIVWLGFALGAIFGFVGNKTNFCTMGAVSDIVNMGSWTRMRMWLLAIAIAIIGVWAMQLGGLVDTRKSIYAGANLVWLSNIVGGLLFGIGMTLASGCTSKTLIRIGGGNLKSLVVFVVLGVSAYVTLKGLFGVWRVNTLDTLTVRLATTQDLPTLMSSALGLERAAVDLWVPLAIGALLLAFVLSSREVWSLDALLGGIVVGLTVVGGWYVTGHLGFVAEHPETLEEAFIATNSNRPESLSLVAPFAYTLELLMFWSDTSKHVTFGIATALGIVAGSLAWALISRTYREESFPNAADLKRHILGAILMGFGGITALGCTIGQGLSGLSTLALGSILTFLSLVGGAALMMKIDYWRMMREA